MSRVGPSASDDVIYGNDLGRDSDNLLRGGVSKFIISRFIISWHSHSGVFFRGQAGRITILIWARVGDLGGEWGDAGIGPSGNHDAGSFFLFAEVDGVFETLVRAVRIPSGVHRVFHRGQNALFEAVGLERVDVFVIDEREYVVHESAGLFRAETGRILAGKAFRGDTFEPPASGPPMGTDRLSHCAEGIHLSFQFRAAELGAKLLVLLSLAVDGADGTAKGASRVGDRTSGGDEDADLASFRIVENTRAAGAGKFGRDGRCSWLHGWVPEGGVGAAPWIYF